MCYLAVYLDASTRSGIPGSECPNFFLQHLTRPWVAVMILHFQNNQYFHISIMKTSHLPTPSSPPHHTYTPPFETSSAAASTLPKTLSQLANNPTLKEATYTHPKIPEHNRARPSFTIQRLLITSTTQKCELTLVDPSSVLSLGPRGI